MVEKIRGESVVAFSFFGFFSHFLFWHIGYVNVAEKSAKKERN